MKATNPNTGRLNILKDCYIVIPTGGGGFRIPINNLPDITDSKGAIYSDEQIIGRSAPLKTYSHSDNRVITIQMHLVSTRSQDLNDNLRILRALESVAYPREAVSGLPYIPPPVCRLRCGELLGDGDLCVLLQNYNVKFPTDVAWDENSYVPYKFDIETTWHVVYKSSDLPGQEKIFTSGR